MNILSKYVLCLLLISSTNLSAEALPAHSDDLSKALKRIDMERKGRLTDTLKLENDCLALLNKDSSPEDKGKIYRQIVQIYALNGLTQPDKCIDYCKLAMAYPLEVASKIRLCISLASALEVKSWKARGDEFVQARSEIALACFKGLEELSDRNIPAERQKLPVVERFDCDGPPDSPQCQELMKKNKEQMAAWLKAEARNTLVHYRKALVEKVVRLYSQPPQAKGELIRIAQQFNINEDIVTQILKGLEKK